MNLKPCPFCGSDAAFGVVPINETNGGADFIACANSACGASTNVRFSAMDDARPLLAEQWNRRATSGVPERVMSPDSKRNGDTK